MLTTERRQFHFKDIHVNTFTLGFVERLQNSRFYFSYFQYILVNHEGNEFKKKMVLQLYYQLQ